MTDARADRGRNKLIRVGRDGVLPPRRLLRVVVFPHADLISIRGSGVEFGLDRSEAIALARALVKAVDELPGGR